MSNRSPLYFFLSQNFVFIYSLVVDHNYYFKIKESKTESICEITWTCVYSSADRPCLVKMLYTLT